MEITNPYRRSSLISISNLRGNKHNHTRRSRRRGLCLLVLKFSLKNDTRTFHPVLSGQIECLLSPHPLGITTVFSRRLGEWPFCLLHPHRSRGRTAMRRVHRHHSYNRTSPTMGKVLMLTSAERTDISKGSQYFEIRRLSPRYCASTPRLNIQP